ncbi:sensor histidine kinase [Paenibacillus sp. NPDC058177]|uniref:sensor histidine kinase n=1 Tax=Paenibacillus sp. NPDC058177 TaxID=3346369 RepID=UPI0036DF458C
MAKHKPSKPYSIKYYVRIMLVISFIALVVDLAISIASISIVKQQSTRYLQDTAELYINRINYDFNYISHFMGWALANDDNIKTMSNSPVESIDFREANEKLRMRFAELQRNYGQGYNFFFYLENHNFFLNCAPMTLSYSDYLEVKRQIISLTENKGVYDKFYAKWTPILANGKYFIISFVPYHDRYLVGLISANDLIAPLQQMNLGADGYASLVYKHGTIVSGPDYEKGQEPPLQEESKPSFLDLIQSRTTVISDFANASLSVKMVIKFGTFEKIMIAQLLILVLFFLLIFTLSAVMILFMRKVLSPIQSFSENLGRINAEGEPADFESSTIIELEQANGQFKQLVDQLKKFKIEMYEQELEKQKIRLDYMKMQIKPHFFLNCLTSIYSMAQIQMYEEIEEMSMATSKYFRYIFQSGENFVRLEDEIEHVRIYLDIQKSRYRNAFSYHIERPVSMEGLQIPPLVLQTFIENSVKYAVSRDQELQIRLSVFTPFNVEAGDKACIRITDTGPGFPPEILEKLSRGDLLDQTDGHRIGITNTQQRLELLYGRQAEVHFSNMLSGGACVTILLPKVPQT